MRMQQPAAARDAYPTETRLTISPPAVANEGTHMPASRPGDSTAAIRETGYNVFHPGAIAFVRSPPVEVSETDDNPPVDTTRRQVA